MSEPVDENEKPASADAQTPDAVAHVAPAGTEKERLTGIMYSERQWIVAPWMKAAFFYSAITLLVGLVLYGVDKRVTMQRLTLDSVVEPTPVKDVPAPDFSLPSVDDATSVQLSSLKGKWVFVNFWATWCPPCRDEMPSMEMLMRRLSLKHKDSFEMVAVSVDDDWNEVGRFFGETAPSFRVIWDRSKAVSKLYGTRKFPETFLVDPNGNIVVKFVGPRDWYNVGTVTYFEDLLSGKRTPT